MKRKYNQPSLTAVNIKLRAMVLSTSTASVQREVYSNGLTDLTKDNNTVEHTSVWDDDWSH